MLTLEDAAVQVANNSGSDDTREVFIDPITITVICAILGLILQAIRLWCQWRQGKKTDGNNIKEVCARPPLRIRRRVQRVVRDKMSPEMYAKHGDQMVNAIFAAGANADPTQLEELVNYHSPADGVYEL